MKYETLLLSERRIKDLSARINVMIEEGWIGVGDIRSDGSYYMQTMKRVVGCNEDKWEM